MNRMLRERLIQVAASQDVVYYSEIAPLVAIDMSSPPDREEIGRLLGEISEFEHDQGRPLLSAVAISHDGNRPGKGFYNLAQELGLHEGSHHDSFLDSRIEARSRSLERKDEIAVIVPMFRRLSLNGVRPHLMRQMPFAMAV